MIKKDLIFKNFIFIYFFIFCISCQLNASIRIDLGEKRSPSEVVEKSLFLGNEQKFHAPLVGTILTDKETLFHGTGIALDAYTILTAAHIENLKSCDTFCFKNPHPNVCKGSDKYKISRIIIHPEYEINKFTSLQITKKNEELYVDSIPLKIASNMNYSEFDNSSLTNYTDFKGVDLAIIKLEDPIKNNDLIFPEILDSQFNIVNEIGIILGHGAMKYNFQDKGPTVVETNPEKLLNRHCISSKVTSYKSKISGHVLYGNYKGSFINGNESFIPNSSMLMTEGLPVCGDSGGPLLIQHEGKYKLAGILSKNISLCSNPLEGNAREMFKDFTQPIFPQWVDVRQYKDWIMENLK